LRTAIKHDFCPTEQMAIAMYNGIQNQPSNLNTFEEKLAHFGEFGYFSTSSHEHRKLKPIYDKKVFDNTTSALSCALGNKFDKKFFMEVLERDC